MEYFMYAMMSLCGLSALSQISWIAKDEYPVRTRKYTVWDAFANILIVFWGIILIID